MFCGQCGKEIKQPLARFCAGCGAAVLQAKVTPNRAPEPREIPNDLKQGSATTQFEKEQPRQLPEKEDTHSKIDPIGQIEQKNTSEDVPRPKVRKSVLPEPEVEQKPAGVNLWIGAAAAAMLATGYFLYSTQQSGIELPHAGSPENAYVNTLQLNVRSGPGPKNPVVTRLSQGDPVIIIGRAQSSDGGGWAKVRAGSFEGWVNQKLLSSELPERNVQQGHGNGIIGPEDVVPTEIDRELDECTSHGDWHDCFERINSKLAESVPDAMDIQNSLQMEVWLREFQEKGRVDLARVDEMTTNHMDSHYILVNGTPKIIWVATDQQVNAAIERHPLYPTLLTKYRAAHPEAFQYSEPSLFPARFSGLNREETLPDGGQRFVFAHALLACMGCAMGGDALVAYDFDRNGNFLGQTLLGLSEPDPEEVSGDHSDEAMRHDDDNRHSYVRQMLSSSMNSDEGAIQEAKRAIEQLPPVSRGDRKTARAGNDQGIKYLNAGQFSEAISAFEKAYQADPGDVEIINNLGYAYLMNGDLETAEQNLLTTLSLEPGRTAAWTNLGQMYAKKGDEQSAAGSFANAYRFSKNRLKTRDFLTQLTQEVDNAVLKNSVQQATQFAENHFLELGQAEKTDRPSTRKKMNTDDEKFWNDFSGKAERFLNQ